MNLASFLLAPAHRPVWRWLLAALVVVVSWFAFKPASGPDALEHLDKVRHAAAFATLAVVSALGWTPGRRQDLRIAIALLGYGLFIELVQSQLPTRSASAADWAADAVGVACGLAIARVLQRRR